MQFEIVHLHLCYMQEIIILKISTTVISQLYLYLSIFGLVVLFIIIILKQSGGNSKKNELNFKVKKLKKDKKKFKSKINDLKQQNNEFIIKEKELENRLEIYDKKVKHSEVQANNTRLGAHFLKNILFRIKEDYENQYKTLSKSQFLSIDILKTIYKLLDYNVDTLNQKKIHLNTEITHINLYLNVIKYLNSNLILKTNLKTEYQDLEIFPTLLFPFIENALKHGNLNSQESILNIELIIINKTLSYKVSNTSYYQTEDTENENKQGFGLGSLEKTLDTYYPKRYDINLKDNKTEFISILKVEL